MPPSRRIYVDVDDVLAQTGRMFLDVLAAQFDRRVEFERIRSYHLGDSFSLAPAELAEFMRLAHEPEALASIEPMPGAPAALARWLRSGYEVVVVTGRPPATRQCTLAWLERHAVPFSELHLLDKYSEVYRDTGGAPPEVLTLADLPGLDLCLAVEDFPGIVEHLAGPLRVPVALFDRPWNRAVPETGDDGGTPIVRCRDWAEIERRFAAP